MSAASRRKNDRVVSDGLPSNIDAERYVLAAVLQDDEVVFPNVAGNVTSEVFSIEKHRRIWRRMSDLHGRGERIDRITVYNELKRHGEAESCDGISYLVSLDDGMPQVPKVDGYVKILLEKAARRKIIFACQHMQNRALSPAEEISDIMQAGQELFTIAAATVQTYRIGELPSVSEFAGIEPEYIHRPVLPKANLIVFTGSPEAGKSSLAFAIARDALRHSGIPVLILDRDNPANVVRNREVRLHIEPSPQWQHYGQWLGSVPEPDSPAVLSWVKTCEPKPIIQVDSMGSFLQGGDENEASIVRAFFDRCRWLTGLGASVIVIHNNGKDTEQFYRGSSAFHDAIDVAYRVTNFSSSRRLDKLRLQPFKHRFGESQEVGYDYSDGNFTRSQPTEIAQPFHEQLMVIIRLNPGLTRRKFEEIIVQRGLPRHEAREWLDGGVLSKTIRRESGPRGIHRHFWMGGTDAE